MIDDTLLLKRWVHSHEEDKGDRIVYRTSEFAFPPARGRTGMTLASNGHAEFEGPGPVDRGVKTSGSWVLEGNLLTISAPGWSKAFEVESVAENMLIVRRR